MDMCNWVVVEGEFLTIEEEFEQDLYQDRDYMVHGFDCNMEEDAVYSWLKKHGFIN